MANIWTKFNTLLGKSPTIIGTILSNDVAKNTSLVELIGGGDVRVTGIETVGLKVFIKDSTIIGKAPNLTSVNIEI